MTGKRRKKTAYGTRKAVLRAVLSLFVCAHVFLFAQRNTVFAAEEGYWYLEDFGIAEIHEAGITGEGVKIADIDTMINLGLPWMSDVNIVLRDKAITQFYGDIGPESDDFQIAFHATDMVGLLQGNGEGAISGKAPIGIAPDATIYHYAAVTSEDDEITGGDVYDEAVRLALEDNVDLIMIPAGGKSDYARQYPYILDAIRRGIPVLVAHANDRVRIDQETKPEVYEDAQGDALSFDELVTGDWADEICYWPGIVTVQALDENYRLQVLSRIEDSGTDIVAPGEGVWMQQDDWGNFEPMLGGCSAATTTCAGYLALAMQKWPDATGNQILQLMARTAGQQYSEAFESGDMDISELLIDPFYGWGAVDVTTMISCDPSVFPDVNPVLYKDVAQLVKNAQIRGDEDLLHTKELREIAQVLDEQMERADMERPDFIKAVLGEKRGTAAQNNDNGEEDGQDSAQTAGTSDTADASGSADQSGNGKQEQTGNNGRRGSNAAGTEMSKDDGEKSKKEKQPPDESGVRISAAPLVLAVCLFAASLFVVALPRIIRGSVKKKGGRTKGEKDA